MGKYLLITPGYPSRENLYKNPFLHPRVKMYYENGLDVEVFSLDARASYTFDGVDVICGDLKCLRERLLSVHYEKILVHFVLKKQIELVRFCAKDTPLLVFAHGYDVTKWQRRRYLFEGQPLKFLAFIVWTNVRMRYVRHFLTTMRSNEKIVFVSSFLKEMVEEDFHLTLLPSQYAVVPNVVDTKTFSYEKKDPALRLRIVSVRPYHNKNYANDISVACVLWLREEAFFDQLTFTFYGEGKLFDETLAPLKGLDNVEVHKTFLTPAKMASIYEGNGVFLSPARAETQGVARCEACAAGLVAVTSDVGAVREFMKDDFAFITKSAEEMAQAIRTLYEDETLFCAMSEKAHEAMQQYSAVQIFQKEKQLLDT